MAPFLFPATAPGGFLLRRYLHDTAALLVLVTFLESALALGAGLFANALCCHGKHPHV